MRVALALEGHAGLAVLSRQPGQLGTGDPGDSGQLGAHHTALMGRTAEDLPGRGRIEVGAGEGDMTVGEQMGLERRSALPAVGGLVD